MTTTNSHLFLHQLKQTLTTREREERKFSKPWKKQEDIKRKKGGRSVGYLGDKVSQHLLIAGGVSGDLT